MFNPGQLYMPARALAPLARRTINWAGLLSNTQKTLNIVNQAIPIVYQVKPMVNNARTIFKIANEFTKVNSKKSGNIKKSLNKEYNNDGAYSNNSYIDSINNTDNIEGPSFFI